MCLESFAVSPGINNSRTLSDWCYYHLGIGFPANFGHKYFYFICQNPFCRFSFLRLSVGKRLKVEKNDFNRLTWVLKQVPEICCWDLAKMSKTFIINLKPKLLATRQPLTILPLIYCLPWLLIAKMTFFLSYLWRWKKDFFRLSMIGRGEAGWP